MDLSNIKHFCNDNISGVITDKDRKKIERDVERNFQKVLEALRIDTANDHNTHDTANI